MLFKTFNLTIESDFDLKLPISNQQEFDVCFKKRKIDDLKVAKTNIFRKSIQARVGKGKNSIILDWDNIARFEALDGKSLYYQRFENDDNIFRLFAISEALGLVLHQRGFFLLHGSAVKVGEKAIVFIGVPGAGKSTTVAAFAKTGHTVLSDDMTAITFDNSGKAVVLPAYPEIKIWQDSVTHLGFDKSKLFPAYEGHNKYLFKQNQQTFPNNGIVLEQIVVLQKPFSKKTSTQKVNNIPIELLKYFPLPHQLLQGNDLQRHFLDSLKIASQVSVVNVNRPKTFSKLFEFINTFQ